MYSIQPISNVTGATFLIPAIKVFTKLGIHLSDILRKTTVHNCRSLMNHMNGWLSLFIVAAFNHNRLTGISSPGGIKEPSADRNKEYERIEKRFIVLRGTQFAKKFYAVQCDGIHSSHCVRLGVKYESDELGHYRHFMQDLKTHLQENVMPVLPFLEFPPLEKPKRGQGAKLRLTPSPLYTRSEVGINDNDSEEAGPLVPTTRTTSAYQPYQESLNSAKDFSFKPSDICNNQSSLREDEEVIPMLDKTWLTTQRECPTMKRLEDCVRYIKILQQTFPKHADSESLREKLTALTYTVDYTLYDLRNCFDCRSIRLHILRWLGFLAVVLCRVKSIRGANQGVSFMFSDLTKSMDALKARGDRDYPTGCQCCWQFSSHRRQYVVVYGNVAEPYQ
jgi:hypothetical protein